MRVIREGMAYLQQIDPEIFQQFTTKRKHIVWYIGKPKFGNTQIREIFVITDKDLAWGKEGVVVFCVQCIFLYNLKYCSVESSLDPSHETRREARHEIRKKLLNWIRQHHLSPEMENQYERILNVAENKLNLGIG